MLERRRPGTSAASAAFDAWVAAANRADGIEVGQIRRARYWLLEVVALDRGEAWLAHADGRPGHMTRSRAVVETWPVVTPAPATATAAEALGAVSS